MRNQELNEVFADQLSDLYNAENQIVELLPNVIKLISLPELKEFLTRNLKETENQTKRIERIMSHLNLELQENPSEAVEGLVNQAKQLIHSKSKSPALDAAIIASILKLKHYQIAAYATLKTIAKHLAQESEITSLLQETLTEVGSTDKTLARILDNPQFSGKEAAESGPFGKKKGW